MIVNQYSWDRWRETKLKQGWRQYCIFIPSDKADQLHDFARYLRNIARKKKSDTKES